MSTILNFRAHPTGRVPTDSFRVRLAIVRAEMGWNYDQAHRATGINSETWRLWEHGKRRCSDIERASHRIADATGYSYEWLMLGGQMAAPAPVDPSASSGWTSRRVPMRLIRPTRPQYAEVA